MGKRAYLLLGIENQTHIHYAAPVKGMLLQCSAVCQTGGTDGQQPPEREERAGTQQRGVLVRIL